MINNKFDDKFKNSIGSRDPIPDTLQCVMYAVMLLQSTSIDNLFANSLQIYNLTILNSILPRSSASLIALTII